MKEKKYLVDTNIIIRYPDILNVSLIDGKILVPDVVVQELVGFSRYNNTSQDYINLINDAQSSGLVNIISSEVLDEDKNIVASIADIGSAKKGTDIKIMLLAKQLSEQGRDVTVVTDDSDLARGSNILGVTIMTGEKFLEKIKGLKQSSELLAEKVKNIERKSFFNSALSLCVGIISGIFAVYIKLISPRVINEISAWGFVIGIIILSLAFFWLRQHYRLSYGTAEYAFGLFTAIRVIKNDIYLNGVSMISGLQVIAGFYVMVRGLDNITKGMSGKSWFPRWKRIFGE